MRYEWHDLAGNVGVATILLAYLAMQLGRLEARGALFCALNAAGAGLVVLSLTQRFNLSAFVVEGAWVVISLVGLARALAGRATPTP